MREMMEKLYVNDDLKIDLPSYIDNKQNVWFKGKDIAQILGYSKPRNALKRHVSEENHMSQLCWNRKRNANVLASLIATPTKVQNEPQCWGPKRGVNKSTPEGNGVCLLMSSAFTNSYLVPN